MEGEEVAAVHTSEPMKVMTAGKKRKIRRDSIDIAEADPQGITCGRTIQCGRSSMLGKKQAV